MKERFENRKLTGPLRLKLERDDHSCGKYWEADKAVLVRSIVQVLDEYDKLGYVLTLRQLYYQLVARNIMPNDQICYGKLSALLDDCRYSGVVDWDSIEDRGRIPHTPYFEDSVKDALQRTLDCYKLDRRLGQLVYVELWSEKDAISNILKSAVHDYTITVGINKGFASSTAIYNAYQRFIEKILDRQKVVVLYAGDFDPSGRDMIRDIRERLEFMMSTGNNKQALIEMFPDNDADEEYPIYDLIHKHGLYSQYMDALNKDGCDYERWQALAVVREFFVVESICLTQEQIEYYNLPPNPAKLSDPRAKKYVEEFGDISWEVDALSPSDLRSIIRESVSKYVDEDEYKRILDIEEGDIEKIKSFINSLDE